MTHIQQEDKDIVSCLMQDIRRHIVSLCLITNYFNSDCLIKVESARFLYHKLLFFSL